MLDRICHYVNSYVVLEASLNPCPETRASEGADRSLQAPAATTDETLLRWAETFGQSLDRALLPPHSPQCVGCGPNNPHGLQLVVHRDGDAVVARHAFDSRHAGAPGVAHGGLIATAFDDLFGFVLYLVGELAVTRNLSVDYLAPVCLGVDYELRATHGRRTGRKLPVTASMTRIDDGTVAATATATFIIVDIEHFHRAAQTSTGPRSAHEASI